MSLVDAINNIRQTNVTQTTHRSSYDAISVTRPELTQSNRTILITGGGTGAGFAMAQSFVRASAATVIIIGRRPDVLDRARSTLEDVANTARTETKIITQTCDIANVSDVNALWDHLASQDIIVDVFVSNAAAFADASTLMGLGADKVWNMMETNLKAPIYFTERFCKQNNEKQKFIINVTTVNIHATHIPGVADRAAYTLGKFAGTLFFQFLAQDYTHDKVQVVSFHPGLLYNEYWASMGVDAKHLDDKQLTGSFAVWAASKEAAFLHGRTVWVSWDVEELKTGPVRKRIDEDFYFLRGTVGGLVGGDMV